MSKVYRINEVFYSLQGEGAHAGRPMHFIRFSGCNLKCSIFDDLSGFDCDTEFTSGFDWTIEELVAWLENETPNYRPPVCLTGGEPALQLDVGLLNALRASGFPVHVETNGTVDLREKLGAEYTKLSWVVVSPKTADHTIRLEAPHEIRYVRNNNQGIPKPGKWADGTTMRFLSPAASSDGIEPSSLDHCMKLCRDHPEWKLSVQMHKLWGVR